MEPKIYVGKVQNEARLSESHLPTPPDRRSRFKDLSFSFYLRFAPTRDVTVRVGFKLFGPKTRARNPSSVIILYSN